MNGYLKEEYDRIMEEAEKRKQALIASVHLDVRRDEGLTPIVAGQLDKFQLEVEAAEGETVAFLMTNILKSSDGKVRGVIGMGGTPNTINILLNHLTAVVVGRLLRDGFCTCPACQIRHTLEIARELRRYAQEDPEAEVDGSVG